MMRCITASVTKVKPLCRSITVCRGLGALRLAIRMLPSASVAWLSNPTRLHAPSSLEKRQAGLSVRHMPQRPALHARSLHAAAGQAASTGPVEELHPKDLQEILKRVSQEGAADVQLIDVREDFEHQTASLPGFKLMPMSRLQEWAQNIHEDMDPGTETVLLCHHGVRSMRVAGFLASQGFQKLRNVTGGIDAYAREVDSSVPLY